MLTVRAGTPAEFTAFNGNPYPIAWCVREPEGIVVEDGSHHIVATAAITVDIFNRTWVWFEQESRLSAALLHRNALHLLERLQGEGRVVYAFCEDGEPGAARWFRRMGFEPLGMTTYPTGGMRLAWRR